MLPLAKVFTVTKNETDLIEDFIVYHGNLFGFQNVVVIDNMSTCPVVKKVYNAYMKRGIVVVQERRYDGTSQGDAFTKHMIKYRKACRFLIGLDTDEFFMIRNANARGMKTAVERYLASLPKSASKFLVKEYMWSIPNPVSSACKDQMIRRPAVDITTFGMQEAFPDKTFFRADKFVSTVNGCHSGRVSKGSTVSTLNKVTYAHYHDTGARRSIERARLIVSGYGYANTDSGLVDQLDSLVRVTSSTGAHRVLEYALFISKTLTLNTIVNAGHWPTQVELETISRTFPTIVNANIDMSSMAPLPANWQNLYDDLIFHNPPLKKGVYTSTVVRDIIMGGTSVSPPGLYLGNVVQKPKKIALMLSGHFRVFGPRREFWTDFKKRFGNSVDIFVHTWNESGLRSEKEWINIGNAPPDFENISKTLKPVSMSIEEHAPRLESFSFQQPGLKLYYANFPQLAKSRDFSRNIGSQLYSIMKCWELVRDSGRKYDILVRLRADCILENFEGLVNRSTTFMTDKVLVVNGSHNHVHPGGGGGCGQCDNEFQGGKGTRSHASHGRDICDLMYVGKPSVMSKVCNMFKNRKELVKSFKVHNEKVCREPEVQKYLVHYPDVIGVSSSKVYETKVKAYYPERLIREYMKDFWILSDPLGMVPKIQYK